jgi:organic radical activating enzyme
VFRAIAGKFRRLEGWSDLAYKVGYHYFRLRRRYLTPWGRFHWLQYRRRRLAWRAKTPLDYPNVVHLELTARCNARCTMCPHSRLTRPKTDMSWELVREVILDWPPGGIDRAFLFFFGEPLLYRRLPEVVALVKERQPRAFTFITTNGQLLVPELTTELWRAGLDGLAVSYQGDEAPLHEQIMVGIRNAVVEANIAAAERLRREINPRAVFKINSLIMPQTSDRVEAIREKWEAAGITLELTPAHDEYRILDPARPVRAVRRRPCPQIYDSATVYAHGEVGFCCSDPDASLSIGNVADRPLGALWSGARARGLRRRQAGGDFSGEPICSECTMDLLRGPIF